MDYDTRSAAQAATILGSVSWVRTQGYASIGDGGGALYKRVGSQPAHAGKFQSADGAWWELQADPVTPEMFGGSETNTSVNNTAFPDMCAYLASRGGGTVLLEKLYYKNAVFNVTQSKITFTSTNRGGVWLKGTPGPSRHVFFVTGSDVRFSGLELRGDAGVARPDAQFCILGLGCNNILVENCQIHHLLVGVWLWNCDHARIINNKLTDMVADGIHIENGCSRFLIHGNTLEGLGDDCIVVLGEPTRVPSADFPTYVRPTRGVICGNFIERTHVAGSPIRLSECDFIDVIGNIVNGCGAIGIALEQNSGDTAQVPTFINIIGNLVMGYGRYYSADTFYHDHPSPADSAMTGIAVFWGSYVNVADNIILEGAPTGHGSGVRVDGLTSNVTIRNNQISLTTNGIVVQDSIYHTDIHAITIHSNEIVSLSGSANNWCLIIDKQQGCSFAYFYIHDNVFRSEGSTHAIYIQNTGASGTMLVKDNVSFASGAFAFANAAGVTAIGNVSI